MELLIANPRLTRSDLTKVLKLKDYTIQYNLRLLIKADKIVHRGPNKAGYWEIIDDGKIIDNKGVKTTKKITQETTQIITQETTQKKILELLAVKPTLSKSDLSKVLKVKEDTIKYNLSRLKKTGKIIHRGADKGGYWEIIKK